MCGSYPAAGNNKIVLLDHTPARLNASTYVRHCLISAAHSKKKKSADSDVHLAFFIRYHLDSLPTNPFALALSPK
jgi:hypothetical protein